MVKFSLGINAWTTTNINGIMPIYKRISIHYQKKVAAEKNYNQPTKNHTQTTDCKLLISIKRMVFPITVKLILLQNK